MTELLYLKDSYQKEFMATVVSVEGKKIELDKTCFYAQGGGQLGDTGKLLCEEKEYIVENTAKESGKTMHLAKEDGLKKGDKVKGIIDWGRRYKMMQMHSSAHCIGAAIFLETKNMISGNQLGLEQSRMDFDTPDYSPEFFKKLEEKANSIIEQNLNIAVSFISKEEALKDNSLFRLKDDWRKDPKNAEMLARLPNELRIIAIGNVDRQLDGGTHVKNTSEIGRIKIVKTSNQGAQNRRIYWALE